MSLLGIVGKSLVRTFRPGSQYGKIIGQRGALQMREKDGIITFLKNKTPIGIKTCRSTEDYSYKITDNYVTGDKTIRQLSHKGGKKVSYSQYEKSNPSKKLFVSDEKYYLGPNGTLSSRKQCRQHNNDFYEKQEYESCGWLLNVFKKNGERIANFAKRPATECSNAQSYIANTGNGNNLWFC